MLVLLALTVLLNVPFAQQVQEAYAQQDADALRSLLRQADSQSDSLLARYRLYPLTENASLVDDLPKRLDGGSARAYALLSGLWSYRAGEASIFSAVSYGRRSANVLETAKEKDPDDPYVLLVEGQSLLFRPAIAGRDAEAAADRFGRLAEKVTDESEIGITPTEARVWKWLALREAGHTEQASTLYEDLLSLSPPPLYRQFLKDPPEV
jgi:hypothetical protein